MASTCRRPLLYCNSNGANGRTDREGKCFRSNVSVLASSAGVPVIALSYDPKIDGMMKELGQQTVVRIPDFSMRGDPMMYSEILGCAERISENRAEIVASLGAAAGEMRTRAREDMLFVKSLIGK